MHKNLMIKTWISEVTEKSGPLYQRLAEKIESDIVRGVLSQGDKLPPQRDLADDLGTTIGTVGRAYSLLREKGLVSGEVGRGTYILKKEKEDLQDSFISKRKSIIFFNKTTAPDVDQNTTIAKTMQEIETDVSETFSLHPSENFPLSWLEAGRMWLSQNSFHASRDTIIPFLSTHTGFMATILGLTAPGDTIVFEHLTSAEIARGIALMGRKIVLVHSDAEGINTNDLEKICQTEKPKIIFLIPTAQNPTAIKLSNHRRLEIARIAGDYNLIILEDTTYTCSTKDNLPLLAELAPERSVVTVSLSKTVSHELTAGWISCPPSWYRRIRIAQGLVLGGVPFSSMELAARLVLSGEAEKIRHLCTKEINKRLAIVEEILAEFSINICKGVPFVWINLPDPWLSTTFKCAAQEMGILVNDSEEFRAGRSDTSFHGVRLSISQVKEEQEIRKGLTKIRHLLEEGYLGYTKPE